MAEQDRLTNGNRGVGAVCSFDGLVRAISDGPDDSLSLEHYPGMTERALEDIRQEAGTRWPLLGLSILHRVGQMRPGERIVSVIATSAHRQAAFDAAAFAMDYLKTRAPFWKLEDDGSGAAEWVEARDSDDRAAAKW
jgi:molybdopterin synthase catalytic subunit